MVSRVRHPPRIVAERTRDERGRDPATGWVPRSEPKPRWGDASGAASHIPRRRETLQKLGSPSAPLEHCHRHRVLRRVGE